MCRNNHEKKNFNHCPYYTCLKNIIDNQKLGKSVKLDGELDLNAPLITNQMSGRFSSASLQQLFKKMYTSVGIDGSSHSGRRSFCTNLSECGVSITNLQT